MHPKSSLKILPCICCYEKNKPTGLDHWSFVSNAIIEHAILRELPLNGRSFTWANNQNDPTFEKLDKVFIFPDWDEHYPLAVVQALERELSDHTPLIWILGTKQIAHMFLYMKFPGC